MAQKARPNERPEKPDDKIRKVEMDQLMREIRGVFRINDWVKHCWKGMTPRLFILYIIVMVAALLELLWFIWIGR